MCGILGGVWNKDVQDLDVIVNESLNRIKHRGPDDFGSESFMIADKVLVLGHTRLSIIDLSEQGHQPMFSTCQKYSIVFNGEIYNYKELREELTLLGHIFKTETDTEVLLTSYIQWGEGCLSRFIGMFAFVIFDKQKELLFCARDAFGIKPFFYDKSEGNFLFSSEISALATLRQKKSQLNYQRCYDYLVTSAHDNSEETFIQDILHLKPGHCFVYDIPKTTIISYSQWWKPIPMKESNVTYDEAVKVVREKFLESVKLHLRSDVKIGAALSGGIDSSAIVCAMRHIDPDLEINTFSYIASKENLDESKWIDLVNAHIKAVPHKITTNEALLVNEIDNLIRLQGEPFGSTSIYAQYKVFELANANGVTVTLEGQGADELLAGYHGFPGYRLLSLVEKGQLKKMNYFVNQWSKWPGRSKKAAYKYFSSVFFSDTFYKTFRALSKKNRPLWIKVDALTQHGVQLDLRRHQLDKKWKGRRLIEHLIYSLQVNGIPHLVRYGDRNAMNFQIEGRVPFLNTELANYVLALPENFLLSDEGETKHIFRDAMRGIVPDEILDRKDKIGFATPEQDWMKLIAPKVREWLQYADKITFLNKEELLKEFDEIIENKKPYSWLVWRWINFVRWYEISEIEE
jgi:asparagine synthase (glutamine-hydrolysing)